jgi:hypothetical protein
MDDNASIDGAEVPVRTRLPGTPADKDIEIKSARVIEQ